MAYRMVYLRIRCNGYDSGASGGADLTAFKVESHRLFRELGWTVHEGQGGVCDTVTKDRQNLYLHPASFSGVLEASRDEIAAFILEEGRLVAAETDCGEGIRTATAKELQGRIQPAEQIKGQITMTF